MTQLKPIKRPLVALYLLPASTLFLGSLLFVSTSWAGPLHDAAETGNLSRIQQLVDAGSDVAKVDARGIWPLLAAVTDGNSATVTLLLKLNADPNQTDQYQYSALHEAASLGHHNIVELLIDAKANINARDINGITPLVTPNAHRVRKPWPCCRMSAAFSSAIYLCSTLYLSNADFLMRRILIRLHKDTRDSHAHRQITPRFH